MSVRRQGVAQHALVRVLLRQPALQRLPRGAEEPLQGFDVRREERVVRQHVAGAALPQERRVGDRTLAEDILQDAFSKVIDRPLFRVRSDLSGPWRMGSLDVYDGKDWRLPPFAENELDEVPPAEAHDQFVLNTIQVLGVTKAEWIADYFRLSKTDTRAALKRLAQQDRLVTVEVEGWNRPEIRIVANLEAPAANIQPLRGDGVIDINLVRDNKGRGDVGSVNFTIWVPYNSAVDIETRIGNLSVSNVRSGLVRAYISSDGDITLTNVTASSVSSPLSKFGGA